MNLQSRIERLEQRARLVRREATGRASYSRLMQFSELLASTGKSDREVGNTFNERERNTDQSLGDRFVTSRGLCARK